MFKKKKLLLSKNNYKVATLPGKTWNLTIQAKKNRSQRNLEKTTWNKKKITKKSGILNNIYMLSSKVPI